MIAHVVLFRPKTDLPREEAEALLASLRFAIERIPGIVRARVGRRIFTGREYEKLMSRDFPYSAILEFESVDALQAYFAHGAHDALGSAVFAAAADILIYDYDFGDGADAVKHLETLT